MEIKIIDEDDENFILSDENLSNDNFVDIVVENKNGYICMTVDIDELLCATKAFHRKRELRLTRDYLIDKK